MGTCIVKSKNKNKKINFYSKIDIQVLEVKYKISIWRDLDTKALMINFNNHSSNKKYIAKV